ncbi:MAG: DUF1684 domain-containing protein [Chloroflexi bacterium]|nr:DUF1684 domain-containing protein [Chloroflexota bacterium]
MTDDHAHHDHDHHDHDHGHHHSVSYDDAVRAYRADKDEFFRTQARSPIPEAEREGFEGLPYFDVDASLRFEDLALEPYTGTEPASFAIPTSDGKLRPAVRAGTLRFSLGGMDQRLTGYTFENQPDDGSIFVPVLDATSGHETYGAGRYLDIEREEDGTYTIDFNLLYHPSCVYDTKYSCPLTPAENRLPVRIEAGERLATSGEPHP